MDPLFDKWRSAGGAFRPDALDETKFARMRPDSMARQEASKAIECIGCGICNAACDVVKWLPDYVGPAALNRVWTLYNDERHEARNQLLAQVATESGLPWLPYNTVLHTVLSQGT